MSSVFDVVKLLLRHRLVNGSAGVLAEEMKHIHAMNITVVLCGDPALFELGAPLRTFYECSLY